MRIVFLFLLIFVACEVQAGQPDGEDLYPGHSALYASKMTAVKMAQSGIITDVFNYLQDTLHHPNVDAVNYDFQRDCFYWTGPVDW